MLSGGNVSNTSQASINQTAGTSLVTASSAVATQSVSTTPMIASHTSMPAQPSRPTSLATAAPKKTPIIAAVQPNSQHQQQTQSLAPSHQVATTTAAAVTPTMATSVPQQQQPPPVTSPVVPHTVTQPVVSSFTNVPTSLTQQAHDVVTDLTQQSDLLQPYNTLGIHGQFNNGSSSFFYQQNFIQYFHLQRHVYITFKAAFYSKLIYNQFLMTA